MKVIKSLPQKEDFFSFFAPLIPSLKVSSYFAQTISFLTEIGIIYAQSFKRLSEILSPPIAKTISLILALIVALVIEIGLRKLLPLVSRQLVNKKLRGDYLAMFIPISLTSLLLIFSSGYLSFNNSFDLVEEIQPPIEEINKETFEESYNKERGETLSQYSRDSLSTAQIFNTKRNSIERTYLAKIESQNNLIRTAKENIRKDFYILRNERAIRTAQQKIDKLNIDKESDLNEIETQKSEALALLLSDKKEALKTAKNSKEEAIGEARTQREEKLSKQSQKTAKYGGLLAYFTIVCLFVLILSIVVEELFKRGSQIEERVFVSPYYFESSILVELKNEISNFLNYYLRRFLSKLSSLTPPPTAPKNPPNLYDLKNMRQKRIELSEEDLKPKQSSLDNSKEGEILSRLISQLEGELSTDNREVLNPILEALKLNSNLYDLKNTKEERGSKNEVLDNRESEAQLLNKEELKLAIRGAKSNLATYKANKKNGRGTPQNNNDKINYWSDIINSLEERLSLA
jgi:hypothetical protein